MKRLLILLMLVSQPAWADWVELGSTDDATNYIDPETVRKTPNGRRVWVMASLDQPKTVSFGTYQSGKFVVEFDCRDERSRILQTSWYSGPMGSGTPIHSDRAGIHGPWEFAVPGSGGKTMLKAVCRMPLR
jgi:hypothetical protein